VRAAAATAGFWSGRVPPDRVLAAILALEKAKLPADGMLASLAGSAETGDAAAGRRWKLIFTSGTDDVRAAVAGGAAGGVYVAPLLTAVQSWRASDMRIENGVWLGFVAAFAFRGGFTVAGRRFAFDFDTVRVRLGPKWFEFKLPAKQEGGGGGGGGEKKGPFFLMTYVDDAVAVARGRSGGVAVWARAGPEWAARSGVEV
jgi:hypothetical protein